MTDSADQPVTRSRPTDPPRSAWPGKRLRKTRGRRIGNAVVSALIDWGLVPYSYVMTTRGRRTGQLHSLPVSLVETDCEKWLVAPYGPVPWVLNARAAGRVSLRRRGRVGMYAVREVSADEAGPVLRKYVRIAGATRTYFAANVDSPVADFTAEAHQHPVFALTLVGGPGAG